MAHCNACHVDVQEALAFCPLCGDALREVQEQADPEAPQPRASYPALSFSQRRARLRRVIGRSFSYAATIPTLICYIINRLTWNGFAWWFYVFVGLTSGWLLTIVPMRLPRPRSTYLIFICELLGLFYLGLIAFATRPTEWYFEYAVPMVVLASGIAIIVVTAFMKRALSKSYSPLLLQWVIGYLPLVLTLIMRDQITWPAICAAVYTVGLLVFIYVARRWLKGELKRKTHW